MDTQLENLLKKALYIDKDIDNKLFLGGNAILSSLSSKITMSYYMQIISEDEKKLLDAVRKIRNKFAHEINVSKGKISDSIKDSCLNLSIPKGMYVPIDVFIGDINNLDLSYNPNVEKDPIKRFVNTFFYLSQCLFLHNLEFMEVSGEEKSTYFTPKPYEFIELFRDLLQKQNDFIEEHLRKCKKKAKEDIKALKNMLADFQDGDIITYRNEEINSKERLNECIEILKEEYQKFDKELKHRTMDDIGIEENIFEDGFDNTCASIIALTALAEKLKRISKLNITHSINGRKKINTIMKNRWQCQNKE